ncbi:MAG: hypothetical protein M0P43_02330 [Arcobacteraceae bacterium]|jgi:hypothetical protein|nr:hypothetical protein [Arcobacteraceae bacterium]
MLFYKECEICGTRINKFQNWWNIYMLKSGIKLKCQNCRTEYKTSKLISIIGSFYSFLAWIIPIILLVSFIDSFKLNLGIEVWFYAFILYSLIELIVMVFLPLFKIEKTKKVLN